MPTTISAKCKLNQLDTVASVLRFMQQRVKVVSESKQAFESYRTRARITKEVKSVVASIIPKGKTGNLLRSFMTVPAGEDENPCNVVLSDISVAPATYGECRGAYSYAAFFEDPGFNSSLKNVPGYRWHRPFFGKLTETCLKIGLKEGHRAVMFEIIRRMPYSK